MPIFQYQDYRNPYGPSIAEALAHQADPQAAAALRAGDIEAQALARQSALRGQLFTQLGAIPGEIQAQQDAQQQRAARQQQLQIGAQTLQENQLTLADRQAQRDADARLSKIFADAPRNADDTYDTRAFIKNVPPELMKYAEPWVQKANTITTSWRAEDQLRQGRMQNAAAAVYQAGGPLAETLAVIHSAQRDRVLPDALAAQYEQQVTDDPTQTKIVLQKIAGYQKGEAVSKDTIIRNPVTNEPIFSNVQPDKPTDASLAVDAAKGDPIAAAALNRLKPAPDDQVIAGLFGKQATGQTLTASETALLEGWKAKEGTKPTTVRFMLNGKPVEQTMTTTEAMKLGAVSPIPAASVTIHNAQQTPTPMPAWALDDSRPAGGEANVLDANIRMTPNGLHQAALNYIANGQFPPTGRGSDPIAIAQRAAITSKVGAIAAASGLDEPGLRAFYKANGQSLAQQQKMQDAVQGFMATADKNAALLQESLKKIPDTGSPLFNQPVRAFAAKVSGDPNLAQFATYLQSVQNEYGRIISQPNLAGQLTDSARHEAETLASPTATVPQLLASLQALQNEGTNRLQSVGEQIQRIQQRMQAGPSQAAPAAGGGGAGFSVTTPDGVRHTFPSAAALDGFKRAAGLP